MTTGESVPPRRSREGAGEGVTGAGGPADRGVRSPGEVWTVNESADRLSAAR